MPRPVSRFLPLFFRRLGRISAALCPAGFASFVATLFVAFKSVGSGWIAGFESNTCPRAALAV